MDIYGQLKRKYRKLGFFKYLYFLIRWRLVDFRELNKLISKKGNILDFGCGIGIFSSLLSLEFNERKVFGYDSCEKSIIYAKKTIETDNVFFISKLEKINRKFEDIIIADVLHHIPYQKQKKTILKLKELLTPNGKIVIQDIDKNCFPKYLIGYLVDIIRCGKKNIYYNTQKEFIDLLEKLNFKVNIVSKDKIGHITLIASL